jgi:SAM-dependent methyltransferase
MGKSNSLPPAGHYDANYGNFQTELYAQIRHEAFGEDIGQNSWLTSDEHDRFVGWLDLSQVKTLLDVACGAGGPALRISATTGCSAVGIDIHKQAITTASSLAAQRGLAERAEFRSVDATGPLPFSDASFDAITCIDAINVSIRATTQLTFGEPSRDLSLPVLQRMQRESVRQGTGWIDLRGPEVHQQGTCG